MNENKTTKGRGIEIIEIIKMNLLEMKIIKEDLK